MADNVEGGAWQSRIPVQAGRRLPERKLDFVDYGDIIVHVFDKESRLFYDIERIWRDGKIMEAGEFAEHAGVV